MASGNLEALPVTRIFSFLMRLQPGATAGEGSHFDRYHVSVILSASSASFRYAIAALSGASLMVLVGCLSMEEAYRAIEWKWSSSSPVCCRWELPLKTRGSADGGGGLDRGCR
jgi:hypothetical protein